MTDPQRKAARGPSQESGQGNDSFEDLVTLHDPTGAASEAYRMLRTPAHQPLLRGGRYTSQGYRANEPESR